MNQARDTQDNDQTLASFRTSIVFLLLKLIAVQILFAFLYLVVRIPKTLLFGYDIPFETLTQLQWFGILYYVIISIIHISTILSLILQYENNTYEIKSQLLAHTKGVLSRSTDTYSLRNVESVTVKQGVLGRLFGYGDIIIHNPSIRQDFHLLGVPHPHTYADFIEKAVSRITQFRIASPRG